MEKPTEAEALRIEYLDLLKTIYATCLTGLTRAKAHMVGTSLGFLITQCALLGALFFLGDMGVVAILVIVVLLTLWWFSTFTKEKAIHEEMKRENEAMKKRLKSIEREYSILTGTDIRQTLQVQRFTGPSMNCSKSAAHK